MRSTSVICSFVICHSLPVRAILTLLPMAGKRNLFEQAMTRGHSAAWDQQWDKAMAYYRAALTEFPDDPKALTSLGFAMLQADRPEEALAVYQRAAALTPGDPVAPEKCGEILDRKSTRLNSSHQL